MDIALLTVFPFIVVFAALTDIFTMTITNRTTLVLAVLFFPFAIAMGLSLETIGLHLAAGGITLLIGFAFFAFGWIGGGDAKLFAAIGLWLGLSDVMAFAFLATMYGAMLSLAIISIRTYLGDSASLQTGPLSLLIDRTRGVPYGVALAAAGLVLYQKSIWFEGAVSLALA